ncbi:hypothetical protein JCM10450v2_006343 [Rhodotorula kratochvilovae]
MGPAARPALFVHPDSAPLAALLKPHLLHSLPLYSTLQTPGYPTPVYATFPAFDAAGQPRFDDAERGDDALWLVLADLGNQIRFFCSYETRNDLTDDQRRRGEELVVGALRGYLEDHRNGRDRISIGAIPDLWTPCIARAFSQPFSASRIHYLPLDRILAASINGTTKGGELLPGAVVVTEGREEDVEEILSTSEVPHPPSYLATRLAHTTVLRQVSPSLPSPSSSSPSPSSPTPASTILAHCTTHRDGSIGTLHVARSSRQRGLGLLALLARARAMREDDDAERDAPVFCYVHKENAASNALMRRAGMQVSAWEVWWCRVRLPLEAEEEADQSEE